MEIKAGDIDYVKKCQCGAYSVTVGSQTYSMSLEKGMELLGVNLAELADEGEYYHCDSCVNNWNVEMCGCGSGLPFGECDSGLPECAVPMQELGSHTNVRTVGAAFFSPNKDSLVFQRS
jgi:hypothetical protein